MTTRHTPSAKDDAEDTPHDGEGADLATMLRAFDWSRTSLGAMDTWPQSLRTSVDIVLRTPVPAIILWGPDGIMIYNDGYAEIAGIKHPHILGQKVLEGWPEAADFNRNVVESGLRGETLTYRDQHFVLHREHGPEDTWFDLNYSPVLDESGNPGGVMALVVETTSRINEERLRRETEERYQLAVESADMIGVCEYNIASDIVYADARFAQMFGVSADRAARGVPLVDYLTSIHPDDTDKITQAIQHTIRTRERYKQEYRLLHTNGDIRSVLARGAIFQDVHGAWTRFLVVVVDLSEQKRIEQALRDSQAELQTITDEMPELVSYLDTSLRYQFVNRAYEEWIGIPRSTIIGSYAADILGAENFAMRKPMLERALAGEEHVSEAPLTIRGKVRDTEIRLFPRRDNSGAVIGVYGFVLDISERKRAAEALRQLNEGLEVEVAARTRERNNIWNLSQDPFVIAHVDGRWISVSPAWTDILGWSEHELVGRTSEWMEHPDDRLKTRQERISLAEGHKTLHFENRFRHRDGSYRWFSWTAVPSDGYVYAVARDVTEDKQRQAELEQTQEQLRQAQKMEAIGQLTGGIAHDFNNMLTGIIGALELMQRRLNAGRTQGLDRYINTATTSANRAAALTHRLLAFSRRQSLDIQPVDINALIVSLEDLLRRTMGEAIALDMNLKAGLWTTVTDANQVENALLNLCINARDAMPEGGKLIIETTHVVLDETYTRDYEDISPGEYVVMSVSDTGVGMSQEVIARAFDPFFTTKPIGQGTGLGLSMIYGFVKQTGGHVRIYSEIGHGTTVKLYLPRHVDEVEPLREATVLTEIPRAQKGERVLVVEDDAAVRMVVVDVLNELGYRVIESAEPQAALAELGKSHRIDLMITDVGLPGMSGRQLADVARQGRPHLPVLFVTGYAEGAAVRGGFLDHGMELISKPFDIDALATKIRDMLAR
jgi:PAS domain S-box-containing protein